ncbi:P-loop NTPase family protein [Parasphingopyxis marina]|uniref:Exopolysaccharide/PEP-CTERM locus tyrosine autokinase n=1 Tax=Parasphingopyxis marina TaxID=2761622 RepID=A0A842HXV5_9SPHN|nr:hypothetical protein [Parasphingopyxis marina]MBC2777926.1 hypothetical protein [Parasphingopyxis marina]
MNQHSSIQTKGSLLERAAQKYDFGGTLRKPANDAPPAEPVSFAEPAPPARDTAPEAAPAPEAIAEPVHLPEPVRVSEPRRPAPGDRAGHRTATVDRVSLAEGGFALPDQRPGALAEEFRIVKRQLLLRAESGEAANNRMVLVCSAKPDEGKTFCSINLALSMAREKDLDIVLADGDFSKPEIARIFGIEDGPGLLDALADPAIDIESCIVETDIPNLSILPAGRASDEATELLASQHTRDALHRLTAASPQRIVIVDSPPALSASPASVLAMHAGQAMMVVKADTTNEAELREALGLLDGCPNIQLLLNSVTFTPNGKRFSSYYGYGDE